MDHSKKQLAFYRSLTGKEPVRAWLKKLTKDERRKIAEELDTLQRSWPIGMPLARKLEASLWELRAKLPTKVIARVVFTEFGNTLVLLHGFIKKAQKTPKPDLATARKRLADLKERGHE